MKTSTAESNYTNSGPINKTTVGQIIYRRFKPSKIFRRFLRASNLAAREMRYTFFYLKDNNVLGYPCLTTATCRIFSIRAKLACNKPVRLNHQRVATLGIVVRWQGENPGPILATLVLPGIEGGFSHLYDGQLWIGI